MLTSLDHGGLALRGTDWSLTGPYFALFMSLLTVGLIALLVALILPRKSFRNAHQGKSYSFCSDFPFELFERRDRETKTGQGFYFAFVAVALLFGSFPLFLVRFAEFEGLFALFILHFLLTAAELAAFSFLTFVPAYDAKRHVILFSVYSGMTLIRFMVDALITMNLGKHFQNNLGVPRIIALGFLIPILLLALIVALLIMSPKMGKWAEMTSTMNADGSTVTTRPRFFILAASEWMTFLGNALCGILLNAAVLVYLFQVM